MLRLLTFGGLSITADDGSALPRVRPPRLALLAVLATARERGMLRERLAALFWPDADESHALQSLRQARYALRNELGREVVRADGSLLSLDPIITSDVADFYAAVSKGDRRRAVELSRGVFLDGFYLPGASAFERWTEDERARLVAAGGSALHSLATSASLAGEHDDAVDWWRELTVRDPLSGRFAVGYLKALAARGDRADALSFARRHEALVRRELESDSDPEIKRLEAQLRAIPSPVSIGAIPATAELSPRTNEQTLNAAPAPDTAAAATSPSSTTNAIRSRRPTRRWIAAGVVATAAALTLTPAAGRVLRLSPAPTSIAAATTPAAYRLYEEGLRLLYETDPFPAMKLMHAAVEEDSTFAIAAFYEVDIAGRLGLATLPDGRAVPDVQRSVLRLARHAPDRDRLLITASLHTWLQEPTALAIADTFATRYPNDPRALEVLSKARWTAGDWAGAVAAAERAVALDSAASPREKAICRLCADFYALEDAYLWWDSLPAAARTQRRMLQSMPKAEHPWFALGFIEAGVGDSAGAYDAYRRMVALNGGDKLHAKLRIDIILGAYETVERDVRPLLASSAASEWSDGLGSLLLALRNEGRLRDAIELHRTGWLPGFPAVPQSGNDFDAGILALESGDPRTAAGVFHEKAKRLPETALPSAQARVRTWNTTLEGMALAAAGDTSAVRALADTAEQWGAKSAYGRDRKAHHYLRGLLFVAQHRDDDAVREFRAAIHSSNFGFTRVNYDLARALIRLGRPAEAVATLQSSLRGAIDASNLYITRTDLHELLAQAFQAAGHADSAAVHYRAVVNAWRHADPMYQPRRAKAAAWLTRLATAPRSQARYLGATGRD